MRAALPVRARFIPPVYDLISVHGVWLLANNPDNRTGQVNRLLPLHMINNAGAQNHGDATDSPGRIQQLGDGSHREKDPVGMVAQGRESKLPIKIWRSLVLRVRDDRQ